jgi:ABC-2 type transport system ATP-binding protein
VHKRYRQVHALRGVDLEIRAGEFFGLLGPNGAGKSTLINITAGLTRADAGRVTVLGDDVVRDYRKTRRSLGVVPQELVFDPFFTVRELLRLQAGYFGVRRAHEAWIEELIAALGLSDKADANMRTLSGGQKRRVLIAQALVHRPEVVVLDEPTAGVDVELRHTLWTFVRRLHREGHTIVLTTHYLEEAEQLCERIGIIHRGRMVALDTTRALLARGIHQTRLRVTFSEAPAALPEPLAALCVSRKDSTLEFRVENPGDIAAVLDAVRALHIGMVAVETAAPDLEDIFLTLTRGEAA